MANNLVESEYVIHGTSAMLTHNIRLANPFDEFAQAIKVISAKKKKTLDDHVEIARLEFLGGVYWNGKIFYIPVDNQLKTLVEAATFTKLGKKVKSSVFIYDDAPLSYSGPKNPEERWNARCFDQRIVKVGQSRVLRTRPKFEDWSLTLKFMFDKTQLEPTEMKAIVETAGRLVGLGDRRPMFGRFEVK